jgi:hypothetical protein
LHNIFACDIGDFGKYALLRSLVCNDYVLGVNWYLNTSGGKTFEYLNEQHESRFRRCSPDLYDTLRKINRLRVDLISEIEKSHILPERTVYFNEPLDRVSNRGREDWLRRVLDVTKRADVVFCDPDNGLAPESAKLAEKKAAKYAFPKEIAELVRRGQSVVLYQYMNRSLMHRDQMARLRSRLMKATGSREIWTVRFRRIVVHTYFIIPSKDHSQKLRQRLCAFANGECKEVFRVETDHVNCTG